MIDCRFSSLGRGNKMGVRKDKKVRRTLPDGISKSSLTLITLFALAVFSSPLMAQMTVRLDSYGNLRRGAGGEFTFRLPENNGWSQSPLDYYGSAGLDNGGFQTFCLEYNEHLWQNTTYKAELSLRAQNGGTAIGYDNISKGTGWLYQQFVDGDLTGYSYDNQLNRTYSAEALQKAIWFLEDEYAGQNNYFVQQVIAEFGNLSEAKKDYAAQDGDVRVMTLTKLNGAIVQDQLMLAPPTVVPVPGALTLAAFGACLVRFKNKRRLA